MPADPPDQQSDTDDVNPEWLRQFYSESKSAEPSDADLLQVLPDFAPQVIPDLTSPPSEKYRIGDELGSGGMKSVLRAFERHTERNVAMAVQREPSTRWKKMARFVREARISASLEHPNIVPIYDIGLDATGKPYFTMKLLGGETLLSLLQRIHAGYGDYRTRYPLNRLLQIFQGICNAVSFAHSRGVIHLDLKPGNIQVGDFGEVLVLDWGLAKVLDKNPHLFPNRLVLEKSLREITSAGVSGTPGFMSPEQSRGENDTLDERTDIFALGALINSILNCRKFQDKTDSRARHESTRTPAALKAVAAKAMSDLPADRYQTVEELAGEVRAYTEGYATVAQQAGALTLLWLLIKRHSVVTALATLSVLIVFAVLSVSLIYYRGVVTKLEDAKESEHRLGVVAAPQLLQQAAVAIHTLDYDQALTLLERVVSLNKDDSDKSNAEAWWDLAAIHLGRQEFDKAADALSHLPKADINPYDHPVDLPGVVEKYAKLSHDKGSSVIRKASEDFVHDVNEANHTAWPYRQLVLAVFFKTNNRNPKTVDYDLIEKMLHMLNPDAKDMVFTHESTPMGLKVSLHSDKVTEISPLAGLPISVLDISGTGNVGIEWLRDAPLISMDLSRSSTWDVRQLEEWPTIQEMRLVGWRNKDYTRMAGLRQLKRVVVDAVDVASAKETLDKLPDPPKVIGE